MNSIAQQALASALGKALPVPQPKPVVVHTFAEVLVQLDVDEINTSGPINHVMFLEGQNYALDMVRAAGETIRDPAFVIRLRQSLIRSALGRPPSHALGIKSVIDTLQVAP